MTYQNRLRLFPRGFLLTSGGGTSVADLPHYTHHRISNLNFYVDVATAWDACSDGDLSILTIGQLLPMALEGVQSRGDSVASSLARRYRAGGLCGVEEALYDVGGRYAVIAITSSGTYCYTDACGTRSVFYRTDRLAAASHVAMLSTTQADASPPQELYQGSHIEGFSPLTEDPPVHAVVPNHRVELTSGTTERFFPREENRALALPHTDRIDTTRELWACQLDQLVKHGARFALSISGGLDSRTMLALLGDGRCGTQSFTYTTGANSQRPGPEDQWHKTLTQDYRIARRLEPFLPRGHVYIAHETVDWTEDELSILSANAAPQHNRWLLPHYLDLFRGAGWVHCRGDLFEIGRHALRPLEDSMSTEQRIAHAVGTDATKRPVSPEAVAEAMENLQFSLIDKSYDPVDIWNWEIRLQRWYAQVLNETDIAFDTVTPYNSRRIIDYSLAYAPADRKDGFFQRELIHASNPYLLHIGINEDTDLFRRYVSTGSPAS